MAIRFGEEDKARLLMTSFRAYERHIALPIAASGAMREDKGQARALFDRGIINGLGHGRSTLSGGVAPCVDDCVCVGVDAGTVCDQPVCLLDIVDASWRPAASAWITSNDQVVPPISAHTHIREHAHSHKCEENSCHQC